MSSLFFSEPVPFLDVYGHILISPIYMIALNVLVLNILLPKCEEEKNEGGAQKKKKKVAGSLNPLEVTFKLEGEGLLTMGEGATTVAALLFVCTSMIRRINQQLEHRSPNIWRIGSFLPPLAPASYVQ